MNFLASLFSRGDWFETRFVGNPEDRFSRVLAAYISVACSTALGQILKVQQIIIFKKIMKRLIIRYDNWGLIIWLRSTSSNKQFHSKLQPTERGNGGDFAFLVAGLWYDPVLTVYLPGWGVVINYSCALFISP